MNNAGVGGGGDALSNPDGWTRVLGVNFLGVLHGVQAFVPAMADGGEPGLVINTGSKQGITQPPGDTAYNVSKSAVKALTEGLAHTLRNRPGCQVTAHLLIPGFTYTGMIARRFPSVRPARGRRSRSSIALLERHRARASSTSFARTTRRRGSRTRSASCGQRGDIVENRPALSRWHPDWKDAFEHFMARRDGESS